MLWDLLGRSKLVKLHANAQAMSPRVLEWELILNHSGKAIDQVDAGRMTMCPKYRFQLTTLYKAKVMNRDF